MQMHNDGHRHQLFLDGISWVASEVRLGSEHGIFIHYVGLTFSALARMVGLHMR